jgi:Cellulase (glycosyl hydrolase family 5)/Bacterial Ig domain
MSAVTTLRRVLPVACVLALGLLPAAASAAPTGLNVSAVPPTQQGWTDLIDSHARSARIWVYTTDIESSPGVLRASTVAKYRDFIGRAKANGIRVLITLLRAPGANTPPPAADYARVAGEVASAFRGSVLGYEIWNEPDESQFWAGGPDARAYTALLKPAYRAIKAADPGAAVVVGGLVGNDLGFVDALYAAGAKGSFDAVGVHTDTACNTTDPTAYLRDASGRISRWSFTGYREIHQAMLEHGDSGRIWMTELGWSTTTATCNTGASAGKKPGGVSPDTQARFLTKAYGCLANDPYVEQAMWFNQQDFDSSAANYDQQLGLVTDSYARKPAFNAFARAGGLGAIPCGGAMDFSGPSVQIASPADQILFYTGALPVRIVARDDHSVQDINLSVDGRRIGLKTVKHGTTATAKLAWWGAGKLSFGPHVLEASARDDAHNFGTSRITVVRVGGAGYNQRIPSKLRVRYGKARHRRLKVKGSMHFANGVRGSGNVEFRFERRVHGHWKRKSIRHRSVLHPFRFSFRFSGGGQWRVKARFLPRGPYQRARVATKTLRVR